MGYVLFKSSRSNEPGRKLRLWGEGGRGKVQKVIKSRVFLVLETVVPNSAPRLMDFGYFAFFAGVARASFSLPPQSPGSAAERGQLNVSLDRRLSQNHTKGSRDARNERNGDRDGKPMVRFSQERH